MNGNQQLAPYIPPDRKYFDQKVSEEDEVFSVTDEMHEKHGKLEKIFERYFNQEDMSNAKVNLFDLRLTIYLTNL